MKVEEVITRRMNVEDIVLHCSGIVDADTHIEILRMTDSCIECMAAGRKYDTPVTAYYGNEVSSVFYYAEPNGLAIWITH